MRAAVVRSFGPAENVLFDSQYPIPKLEGEGKVLVQVKAAGVNPVDTYIRSGQYAALPQLPYIPGREGAGIVEKICGSQVKVKKGDRVWFTNPSTGSSADYSVVDADLVYPLTQRVSFEQGATLGIAYFTAYRALILKGNAQSGESVFIHGASGGVGLAVAQLAKAKGLHVYGSASTEHGSEVAKSNGVQKVYNHKQKDYTKEIARDHPQGFDIIVEMLADQNLTNDLALIAKRGRILIVGSRGSIQLEPRAIMQKEASVVGVMLGSTTKEEFKQMAGHLNELLAEGSIRPLVGKVYPLEKLADAHRDVMKGMGAKGKLVVSLEN